MTLNKSLPKLKESIMARKWFLTGMLCVALAYAFTVVGCTSTDIKSNVVGEYNLITKISSKDFVPLGIISVSATETEIISPFHFMKEVSGEKVSFDLLLQEAKGIYPDASDITNIRIDRIDQNKKTFFDFFIGSTKTVKYIGTALAIKYTDALEEVREPLEGRTDTLPALSIKK